jgi:hypothetical protein
MLRRCCLAFALSLSASSCVLTNVKIPLDIDLDNTALGNKVGEASTQSVLWAVAWGDGGVQAAAQEGGITTITHADTKVFSVLFGVYVKQTTVVYGK